MWFMVSDATATVFFYFFVSGTWIGNGFTKMLIQDSNYGVPLKKYSSPQKVMETRLSMS